MTIPNAETREALRQAFEHQDLTEYRSMDDLKSCARLIKWGSSRRSASTGT